MYVCMCIYIYIYTYIYIHIRFTTVLLFETHYLEPQQTKGVKEEDVGGGVPH